ncbi:DUF6844 domain-containing protein [Shewanella sp. YIC-542]|uniref:DUF6844 domain-containing protein n=1 Tax=Shewanella mytili TaxID=3377111 RepID=UPI00398E36A4
MQKNLIALAVTLATFGTSAAEQSPAPIPAATVQTPAVATTAPAPATQTPTVAEAPAAQVTAAAPVAMTAQEEKQTFGQQSSDTVKQSKTPSQQVKDDIKEYVKEINATLLERGRSHMVKVVSGTATVAVTKDNPMWSHYRANAVRQAIAKARESHLSKLNIDIRNEVINELFNDAGAPKPSPEDFKTEKGMAGILTKLAALIESKLDAELIEAGIDPKLFANSTPTQKQQLMHKMFAEKTVTTAFGDISGMFVIRTFEAFKDDGTGTVGVVMAQSANKRDKIKTLVQSHGQVKADPRMANPDFANIPAALASVDAPYLEAGTQLAYDDKGYPIIISYGQAGVQYTDDADMMEVQLEAAASEAESNAMANLAQSYNMSGDFSREVTKKTEQGRELVHSLASNNTVSTVDPGVVHSIRNILDQSSKMTSSVSGLNGLQTVNHWEMRHPVTGHTMVGVALVWHPIQERQSIALQSGKSAAELDAAQQKSAAQQNAAPQKVTSKKSSSRFDPDF